MNRLQKISVGIIGIYQRCVSPFTTPCCRFHPTCSRYAAQAISKHGMRRGAIYSLKRLAKCHPWHPGGIDEVP